MRCRFAGYKASFPTKIRLQRCRVTRYSVPVPGFLAPVPHHFPLVDPFQKGVTLFDSVANVR